MANAKKVIAKKAPVKKAPVAKTIKIKVGRLDKPTGEFILPTGTTITQAISAVGITLGSNDSVWVNGLPATTDLSLKNGDAVQVVGRKEGGSN